MKQKRQPKTDPSKDRDRESTSAGATSAPARPGAGGTAPGQAGPPGGKSPSEFAGKTVASVFGEIVWLLSRSPKHRHLTLADLEWLVMPPLLLRQFKLYYRGKQPVAVELFAKVSPAVAARFDAGERKLAPAEWRSGDITRLVDKIELAPGAAGQPIVPPSVRQ